MGNTRVVLLQDPPVDAQRSLEAASCAPEVTQQPEGPAEGHGGIGVALVFGFFEVLVDA